MAHQIHEVGGVLAIEDREGWIEADAFGVQPQQPGADRMKRAGPFDGLAGPGRPSSAPRMMRSTRRVISAARGGRRSAAGCAAGRRR